MADVEKFMSVDAGDIEKIMGVAAGDIEAVMGLGIVTQLAYHGNTSFAMSGYGSTDGATAIDIVHSLSVMSTGDATDVGDLSDHWNRSTAVGSNVSSGNRIVLAGGNSSNFVDMHYIAPSSYSGGGASDFGDLDAALKQMGSASNGTRGIFGGGKYSTTFTAGTRYITIASDGNSNSHGTLDQSGTDPTGCQSLTKAYFSGSYTGSAYTNVISGLTISSTADSDDVGDLQTAGSMGSNTTGSSEARCIVSFGGSNGDYIQEIDYMNPASPGNAADFGEQAGSMAQTGPGNGTRVNWLGQAGADGTSGSSWEQTVHKNIEHITLASLSDALDTGGNLSMVQHSGSGWTA